METNKKMIVEYGVYEEIKGKYPAPVLLFEENAKARVRANQIKSIARKNGFLVICRIDKKEVNGELFYALTAMADNGFSNRSDQYHEFYYRSKKKAESVLKEFKKDMEELLYFFEIKVYIVTEAYEVN